MTRRDRDRDLRQRFKTERREVEKSLSDLSISAGFTLLELLVATAILGILLTTLYGSFSRTLRGKARAEDHSALSRMARTTLLRMAQDLQGSFVSSSTSRALYLISLDHRDTSFPQDTLSFFSFAHQPLSTGGREMDQCWINYFVERRPENPHAAGLMRQVSYDPNFKPAIEAHNRLSQTLDGSPPAGWTFPLLERIEGLRFRFFDGRKWLEEWQTTVTLPRAVEITLYLTDSGEKVREFSTVTDLPLAGTSQTSLQP